MSRWDALQPSKRSFRNTRQTRLSSNRRDCSTSESEERDTTNNKNEAYENQLTVWNGLVQRLCTCITERNNGTSDILKELSEKAFVEKTPLLPHIFGESISSVIECCLQEAGDSNVDESSIYKFIARLLREKNVKFTSRGARKIVPSMTSQLCKSKAQSLQNVDISLSFFLQLECVVRILMASIRQLPAEETTQLLLQDLLIPVLLLQQERHSFVFEGIRAMLQDPLFASAILAPLVVGVSNQGEEQAIENPSRSILLSTLQKLLAVESKVIVVEACRTLATAMDAVRKGTHKGGVGQSSLDLDLVTLERFVRESLSLTKQEDTFQMRHETMLLLVSVLQAFPDASSSMSSLVFECNRDSPDTHSCDCQISAPLLSMLHSRDTLLVSDATRAIQELIRAMPLDLWVTGKGGPHQQQYLAQRVTRGLKQTIIVAKCCLEYVIQSTRKAAFLPLCDLVTGILTDICYSDHDLLTTALDLLSTVGDTLTQSFVDKRRRFMIEPLRSTLVASMGGKLTPQGLRVPMPVPMKQWLVSNDAFRTEVYKGAIKGDDAVRTSCVKILSSAVRVEPAVVLDSPDDINSFHSVLLHMTNPSQLDRLDGVKLLENFLLGRLEYGSEKEIQSSVEMVVSYTSSILPSCLNDGNPSIRSSALSAYGSFAAADWSRLFQQGSNFGMEALRSMLTNCIRGLRDSNERGESNGQVRSTACKAVGNACSQMLSRTSVSSSIALSDHDTKAVFHEVLDVMCQSIEDTNPSVRSMAVFALGNLAHALRHLPNGLDTAPATSLLEAGRLVRGLIEESVDKVAGNAIRSSGHICFLLFRSNKENLESSTLSTFFCSLVSILTGKIELALTEATGEHSFTRRSWKQRSVIRKHAWGSCNSLAVVLCCEGTTIQNGRCMLSFQQAIDSMVRCIRYMGSINEKVVIAAAASLLAVSKDLWSQLSAGTDTVGNALAFCLLEVYKIRTTSPGKRVSHGRLKLNDQLQLLLERLVVVATISDVCIMLKHEEISKQVLDFLYEWMTDSTKEESITAGCFESFALALQRQDLCDEISIHQKFASRAMQRYRCQRGGDSEEFVSLPHSEQEHIDQAWDDEL